MLQLIGGSSTNLGSSTVYTSVICCEQFTTTEGAASGPWSAPGVISKWTVTLTNAPGAGKSRTFTIRLNGVNQPLQIVISDLETSGSDLVNTVTVAAGDLLAVQMVPAGTPAASGPFSYNAQFVGTNAKESVYQAVNLLDSDDTVEMFSGLWTGTTFNASPTTVTSVASAPGTITRWDTRVSSALGVGNTYDYFIYKNGVKQDGAGGTQNTQIQITGAVQTAGSASGFALVVAAGDQFYISAVPTSNPGLRRHCWSVAFTATTDGESQFAGFATDLLNVTTTEYVGPTGDSGTWTGTEANAPPMAAWSSRATLSKLYLKLDAAPGSGGDAYVFTLRRNSAAPGGTLTVTITDAETTGQDTTNSLTVQGGQTFDIECNPAVTPTARRVSWAMTLVAESGGGGAGKGRGGKKGGGGGPTLPTPGGALFLNLGFSGDIITGG